MKVSVQTVHTGYKDYLGYKTILSSYYSRLSDSTEFTNRPTVPKQSCE